MPEQHPRAVYLPDYVLFGNEAILRHVFRALQFDIESART